MNERVAHGFGELIADRMVSEHQALAVRWLERLNEVLPIGPDEVFPTEHLLDHIPELIAEIAAHVREPEREAFAANTMVIDKARELGELRYDQRASVHQLLREYRILAGILTAFVQEEAERVADTVDAAEAIALVSRLAQAVSVLQQTTVETFIGKYAATIDEQTRRLEGFNRMVSHELRQPLSTLQFALKLFDGGANETQQSRYREVIRRNVSRLIRLTDQLAMLSRLKLSADTVQTQCLELGLIAREVSRQLRDMADARSVEIRIPEQFPEITVDVAAVELILVNLVSNAIKYSDPSKPGRFVEVAAELVPGGCMLIVRDNGIGIRREHLTRIFDRAFRAQPERDAELGSDGFGLGLSIVSDCLAMIGGAITVESEEGGGTTFRITLPHIVEDARPGPID